MKIDQRKTKLTARFTNNKLFFFCHVIFSQQEIEEKEFVSYMTRGFTQPQANIAAFCRRSAMHRKIYSFLFNIENSMADREIEIMEIRKGMNEDKKDELMALAVS